MRKIMKGNSRIRNHSWLFTFVIVGLFILVALFIRIYPSYDNIFTDDWVKFTSGDTYYYMRLVDNITQNFPHLTTNDPYLLYPDGQDIDGYYFFARIIATISWIVGFGNPSQHVIDLVSAYLPAIMGALVVIPIYFIGRELAGRWAGIVSCGLIAILPGEFLGRSTLGSADHHVAEVLFSTIVMMFFIIAIKKAKEGNLTFYNLRENIKPIAYSLLAGLFLGVYLLTWIGGLLFVFILALYFVSQFVIAHFRNQDSRYLAVVGSICVGVASIIFLPTIRNMFDVVIMLGVALLPFVLFGMSRLMSKLKKKYYPLALIGVGGVTMLLLQLVSPSVLKSFFDCFSIFGMSGARATTIEMQPLLFPNGGFSLAVVWANFGVAFIITLCSLGVLVYGMMRHDNALKNMIVVWSVAMLAMALGQRRFAYYLAVNVALLTGYLSWLAIEWAGFKQKPKKKKHGYSVGVVNVAVAVLFLLLIIVMPSIPSIISVASQTTYAPSDAWCESLDWLRANSPEPFGDANAYYDCVGRGEEYPKPDYAVLAWWDYGYWITRMAHRVPDSNPSQFVETQTDVANILTSNIESETDEMSMELGVDYVVLDFDTNIGKFWAILKYAGREQPKYFDIYYIQSGNQLNSVQLFYPEYYRTFAVRLYNFNGKAVQPDNVVAISYKDSIDVNGTPFKLVADVQQFDSYADAEAFVEEHEGYRIVSDNPFVSPVPLDAVKSYKLAYSSSDMRSVGDVSGISVVKIFRRSE